MAKPPPKPTKAQATSPPAAKSARRAPGATSSPGSAQPAPAPPSARRSTYVEAVALYERGLAALQRHDYHGAGDIFQSVLDKYGEEKELHERVRLYLNICRRQAAPQEATPKTVEERLYAATLSINGGRYDEAITHLRLVRDEDADNDHALYMLAVAHGQRGEITEGIAHLQRAIALNSENRAVARQDPDLEPLRSDDSFRAALDTPSTGRGDRRRPVRTRTAR